MNRGRAYKLLAARLTNLRVQGYQALLARVGQPPRPETVQLDGEPVSIDIEVLWADRNRGELRVRATASGPSTWMTERLEESCIIAPELESNVNRQDAHDH